MNTRQRSRSRTQLAAFALTGALALVVACASPAAAHGIDGPRNLPLPRTVFVVGATTALVLSFVLAEVLWRRPILSQRAYRSVTLLSATPSRLLFAAGRVAGLSLYFAILALALFGDASLSYNAAPRVVLVVFWVAVPLVGFLVGDIWSALNPFPSLTAAFTRRRTPVSATCPPWTAAALVFSFAWLELAHPDPSNPRVIATWILAYSVLVVVCVRRWGAGWLTQGEGFATFFGALAAAAPLGRDSRGRLGLRMPLAALARKQRPEVLGVVIVALGAATFDGLSQLDWWNAMLRRRSSASYAAANTIGLCVGIAFIAAIYLGASRLIARRAQCSIRDVAVTLAPSLVPVVAGYTLAHYWSLLVFDGQIGFSQLSDPLGRGWNLFGTRGLQFVDFRILRSQTSAYIQASALIIGHVAGIAVAHDLTLTRWPNIAPRPLELPMLVAMVVFTVTGFSLLLGG